MENIRRDGIRPVYCLNDSGGSASSCYWLLPIYMSLSTKFLEYLNIILVKKMYTKHLGLCENIIPQ